MSSMDRGTKYRVIRKIASGAFGEIFLGMDANTQELVAIKIEKKQHLNQLSHEYCVYRALKDQFVEFIPKIYGYGPFSHNGVASRGLIMQLLGSSLQTLFEKTNKKFSTKTVLMLGILILDRIEFVHSKHFIHRDIKPDNFAFGRDPPYKDTLYIIDFGLAKMYRNPVHFTHIPPRTGRSLTGTARYASLNAHLGFEQGRRDDLESMAYCLIFFLRGTLPWQGMPGATKQEKYRNIKKKKESMRVSEICEGLPKCFEKFLSYVKNLEFEEMPSYLYLKNLFKTEMSNMNYVFDYVFDWNVTGKQN